MEVETKNLLSEFMQKTHSTRRRKSFAMSIALTLLAISAVVPLVSILAFLISKGFSSLSWGFVTSLPLAYGETGGGMGNAIVGSFILVGLASVVGIPLGLGTGIFLSESRAGSRFGAIVRLCTELMAGVPSIVVGLFAYFIAVLPFGGFSAFAGGLALSVIMIPVIARTSEEVLRLVPIHVREAGLALGLPAWKVLLRIVLRGSRKGLFTAVLLAVARASGETAPLLFTALNNRLWSVNPSQPISSLPVQIYTYATSPSEDWHQQAWAGALLLVLLVLGLSLSARLLLSGKKYG
jgi:phosphate transport system permease protein